MDTGQMNAARLAAYLDIDIAVEADGQIILGCLEIFRQIGIVIILTVKFTERQNIAMKCKAGFYRVVKNFLIKYGHASRQAQADRADVCIGLGTEFSGAAAENLCFRFQFDMDFQADNGFIFHQSSTSPMGSGFFRSVRFCSNV